MLSPQPLALNWRWKKWSEASTHCHLSAWYSRTCRPYSPLRELLACFVLLGQLQPQDWPNVRQRGWRQAGLPACCSKRNCPPADAYNAAHKDRSTSGTCRGSGEARGERSGRHGWRGGEGEGSDSMATDLDRSTPSSSVLYRPLPSSTLSLGDSIGAFVACEPVPLDPAEALVWRIWWEECGFDGEGLTGL